jgi:hypothetical protein
MNGYAMSGWGWLLMTLGMLGFWALVALLTLALLRRPGQPNQQRQPGQQPRPDAEEILAERLVRGEIDPDEYRQRLQTLQETTSRTWPNAHSAPGRSTVAQDRDQHGPGEQQSIRGFAPPGPATHPSPADHWTREQLQAHQARALQQLREYVYAYSPFFRRFHAGRTDHPLRELPVLTKAMAMEHFDQLVTDPAVTLAEVQAHLTALAGNERLHGRYWVAATSGTTGRRGIFLWDLGRVGHRAGLLQPVPGLGRRHRQPDSAVRMAVVSSTTPWHQSAKAAATTTKAAAIPASTAMTLGRPSGTAKPR